MGTTADKLNYLANTKNLIKNAIVNKGQTINSGDSFRSFASKIENIQTGADLNDYFNLKPSTVVNTYSCGFAGLITMIPLNINLSYITDYENLFAYCCALNYIPNFDTTKVTSMEGVLENVKDSLLFQIEIQVMLLI